MTILPPAACNDAMRKTGLATEAGFVLNHAPFPISATKRHCDDQ